MFSIHVYNYIQAPANKVIHSHPPVRWPIPECLFTCQHMAVADGSGAFSLEANVAKQAVTQQKSCSRNMIRHVFGWLVLHFVSSPRAVSGRQHHSEEDKLLLQSSSHSIKTTIGEKRLLMDSSKLLLPPKTVKQRCTINYARITSITPISRKQHI